MPKPLRRILLFLYLSLFPFLAFSQSVLKINGGNRITNDPSRTVTLSISINGAVEMMLSNNEDFAGAQWEPYKNTYNGWKLDESDGIKTIYVKFKDKAGNVSPVFSSKIYSDITPPLNPEMIINNGSPYTRNKYKRVTLRLSAQDASQMMISNDADFRGGRWERYSEIKENWQLPGDDGKKVVFAKFKDIADNESEVVSAEVTLDRVPPQNLKIEIDGGEEFTNHPEGKVRVRFFADDAHEMILRNEDPQWEPFVDEKTIYLEGDDGNKIVAARFRDQAGNISRPVGSRIILDRTPPEKPRIMIDRNAKFTNDPQKKVTLMMAAEGAEEMMVSNFSDFRDAEWEPVLNTKNFVLEGGDGVKEVFIKFKDKAGNVTEAVSDDILLDRQPPTGLSIVVNKGAQSTNNRRKMVDLQMTAKDAVKMRISNTPGFAATEWESFAESKENWVLGGEDGMKTVYVKFMDEAGNESEIVKDNILLDRAPPGSPRLAINNNDEWITDPDGKVTLTLFAKEAVEMMLGNKPDLSDGVWEPYTQEKKWILPGEDGVKGVAVRFRDKSKNETSILKASIKLNRAVPTEGKIVINEDSTYTNDPRLLVNLKLEAKGASEMIITNGEDFTGANWEPFKSKRGWLLKGAEGPKTVSVKFRNAAGNESEVYKDDIILDLTPPTKAELVIDYDSVWTTHPEKKVRLDLKATDAESMMVSNQSNFSDAKWQTYESVIKDWVLEGNDGEKTVYAKFKDAAGNVSRVFKDVIILDRQPPTNGKISINDGAKYTNHPDGLVKLSIYANEAYEMAISESSDFNEEEWIPYQGRLYDFPLSEDDGLKTLYIKFRDQVGNQSESVSAKIMLDREAPTENQIMINGRKDYTNNPSKKVILAIKSEGATQMMISNREDFEEAKWEEIKPIIRDWVLPGDDGKKTIYAKFRDAAGNVSDVVSESIVLDRKPPRAISIKINGGEEFTNDREKTVTIYLKAEDANFMQISNFPDFRDGEWEEYAEIYINWQLNGEDGKKTVYVRFKDRYENVSEIISSDINLKRAFGN